jgi:hypothetical protein
MLRRHRSTACQILRSACRAGGTDKPAGSVKLGIDNTMAWRTYMKPLLGITTLVVACSFAFVAYQRAPAYRFRPFCSNDLTYRLNVTIEVARKQYSSEVVNQTSRARTWLAVIHGGCEQTYGTALSFRLADNRLVLMSAYICQNARRAIADTRDNYRDDDVFAQACGIAARWICAPFASACIGTEWS